MGTHRHVVHHRVHHVVSNALQGVRQGHGPPLGRGDSASRREGQHPPSGAQRSRRCPSHEGDRALERSLQGVHRFAQEALRARQGCSLEARAKSVPPKEPPPHTHTRAFPSSLSPGIEGKGRGHQIEKNYRPGSWVGRFCFLHLSLFICKMGMTSSVLPILWGCCEALLSGLS